MSNAFFSPDGDGFVATELTRGPWSPDHQHGGPPTALVVRAVEHRLGVAADRSGDELSIVRVTVELLRPVRLGRLAVEVAEPKVGRRVARVAASLQTVDGEVLRMSVLAIRHSSLLLPEGTRPPDEEPPRAPDTCEPLVLPFFRHEVGYHTGMELRFARGTLGQGPTQAWLRMRAPLVEGEAPTPVQRVAIAADSGNGTSQVLDPTRFSFVNPDLTFQLVRMPVGEWICLDAVTRPRATGIGVAESRLWDEEGRIGTGLQSLVLDALRG